MLALFCSSLTTIGCKGSTQNTFNTDNFHQEEYKYEEDEVIPAAERIGLYFPILKGKNIALVVNQTSMVGNTHLVDTLKSMGVNIVRIFSPEHGYKGKADAGAKIEDQTDVPIPITSLYGKKKKPGVTDLDGVDMIVFDIQDVGARFYTYISTLHYIMEAGAEQNIPVMVLDRPNPNGFYVDGPVLEKELTSFVGMHPVPIVYGMTIGEYAHMINGEAWLANGIQCELSVIECKNYSHSITYDLPVRPSPNLPNLKSILLYPSLCLFEGTTVSVGRGTTQQFQIAGHPALGDVMPYKFVPVSREGATHPKHQDQNCYGMEYHHADRSTLVEDARIDFSLLIKFYTMLKEKDEAFFLENNFFDKLAGTYTLRKQIVGGLKMEQIRESWQLGLDKFKKVRSKYLIYP